MVSRACELQNTKRGDRWFWKNEKDEAKEKTKEEEMKKEIKKEIKKEKIEEDEAKEKTKEEEMKKKIKKETRKGKDDDDFITDWDKDLKVLVTHLEGSLQLRKMYRRCFESKCLFFHRCFGALGGNMLSWIYIGTKTLALLLAIVQLFIVQVCFCILQHNPSCSFILEANVIKNLQCNYNSIPRSIQFHNVTSS